MIIKIKDNHICPFYGVWYIALGLIYVNNLHFYGINKLTWIFDFYCKNGPRPLLYIYIYELVRSTLSKQTKNI